MPLQGIPRKKKKEIDPFLDTVCPFRASRVKRNRPVFRHGMPLQGIPRKKEIDPFLDTVCPFRASRVINAPICGYDEEKEIVPFLDTVCPLKASRVNSSREKNTGKCMENSKHDWMLSGTATSLQVFS